MPRLEFPIGEHGPMINIGVSRSADDAATRPNDLVRPLGATALVDTGAFVTILDPRLIKELGLHPVGIINIGTVKHAPEPHPSYRARLVIPHEELGKCSAWELLVASMPLSHNHCEAAMY